LHQKDLGSNFNKGLTVPDTDLRANAFSDTRQPSSGLSRVQLLGSILRLPNSPCYAGAGSTVLRQLRSDNCLTSSE